MTFCVVEKIHEIHACNAKSFAVAIIFAFACNAKSFAIAITFFSLFFSITNLSGLTKVFVEFSIFETRWKVSGDSRKMLSNISNCVKKIFYSFADFSLDLHMNNIYIGGYFIATHLSLIWSFNVAFILWISRSAANFGEPVK